MGMPSARLLLDRVFYFQDFHWVFQCQSCEWFTANTGQEVSPGDSVPAGASSRLTNSFSCFSLHSIQMWPSRPECPLWDTLLRNTAHRSESCLEHCRGTLSPSPQLCSYRHNTGSNSPSYPEVSHFLNTRRAFPFLSGKCHHYVSFFFCRYLFSLSRSKLSKW